MKSDISFHRGHYRLFQHDTATAKIDLESFFKIGISDDYILIREDFPIGNIAPGDFSKLCGKMFRLNEEARHNGK